MFPTGSYALVTMQSLELSEKHPCALRNHSTASNRGAIARKRDTTDPTAWREHTEGLTIIRKAYINMNVSNLQSPRSDRPVANQYEITDDNGVVTFQSYQTAIAKKDGYKYTISSDWNYSNTTNKYFGQWLRGWGWHESQIDELKKWLRKERKDGDEVAILGFQGIEVKYVESL